MDSVCYICVKHYEPLTILEAEASQLGIAEAEAPRSILQSNFYKTSHGGLDRIGVTQIQVEWAMGSVIRIPLGTTIYMVIITPTFFGEWRLV